MSDNDQSIFESILSFFFLFILIVIGAYITLHFIKIFPVPSNSLAGTTMTSIFKAVFGGFNTAFIIFLIITILMDVLASAFFPSIDRGIENLIMFFVFVYVGFFLKQSTLLLNVLNANTLMPTPYAFLTQNYFILLILIFIALSTVLNFRSVRNEP